MLEIAAKIKLNMLNNKRIWSFDICYQATDTKTAQIGSFKGSMLRQVR
jgi:hypothetical protein